MFAEFINVYGAKILEVIMIAMFGCFGMVAKSLATKYLNDDVKRALAKTVVQFVEQVYIDLHGEDKLRVAMEVLSEQLAEKKINVTEQEMRIMIEAAVAEFNEVFKNPKEDADSENEA